uniref:Uncharacterized protein n=1 Tax=Anopheles darlingi TaxID=43151 RepID=A0A2M4CKI5_ANODA
MDSPGPHGLSPIRRVYTPKSVFIRITANHARSYVAMYKATKKASTEGYNMMESRRIGEKTILIQLKQGVNGAAIFDAVKKKVEGIVTARFITIFLR